MGPFRVAVLVALVCLLYVTGPALSFQCDAPNWTNHTQSVGPDPFPALRGKVVLVALLKGYCGYCIHQAGKMAQLKAELISEGFPDIDMIIVNGGGARARSLAHNLINASSIPVVQDSSDHVLYRQVFRARKDDFLVYDRCNQAAYYIPHPWSDLDRTITKRVLKAVHRGDHECYCSLDYAPVDPDEMMPADDPGTRFYQTHNMDTLQCSPDDTDCTLYQTALYDYRRRRNRRGRGRNFGGRGALRRTLQRLESENQNQMSRQEMETGIRRRVTSSGFGRRQQRGQGSRRYGRLRGMGRATRGQRVHGSP